MPSITSIPAQVLVCDLTPIWTQLNWELDTVDGHMWYRREELLDLFLAKTINSFQVVTVEGFDEQIYPNRLLNQLQQLHNAVSLVWEHLWFPPECSGRLVILKRLRRTLWMVVVDPHHLPHQPLTSLEQPCNKLSW